MNLKRICVVTGTRSEYGILRLLLKRILKSEKLELLLIVTGMHLLKKFGNTISQIIEDKIPISKEIPMYIENDDNEVNLGKAVGNVIKTFTEVFFELKPDLLLILGDRYEPFAAVIAASTLSIPIAHIHGGDNVFRGQIDEQIRHAITKFAHIHFPATQKSAKRIELMGEEKWRIHMVGSPSIDMIYQEKLLNKIEICKKFNLDSKKPLILCIQHPYVFESKQTGEQMRNTLNALKEMGLQTIIIYPNNDPGFELIIKEIETSRKYNNFKIYKNLDRTDYLSLLKNSNLLIGNSSSGIIETPIFKLPTINIGDRNRGRETAENVINVPSNYRKIKEAVKLALSDDFKKSSEKVKNPYGDGNASERIVKILENLKIDKNLLIKKLTYDI